VGIIKELMEIWLNEVCDKNVVNKSGISSINGISDNNNLIYFLDMGSLTYVIPNGKQLSFSRRDIV